MPPCAGCFAEVPDGSAICPACGAPSASGEPTLCPTLCDIPTPALFERAAQIDRERASFTAGTVLASRYRIVTALGRGGMGEVYRADDLKLNQGVALKFLPWARASDAVSLGRLRQEVRLARQISHPSVCRVFDLGEIEGHSFLCMEYIDGEDLASLLRRIGRLPVDKALEIARQLAAGLAAIHDGGLLHRDLKPGNVMIDGRGRARITDFGLATPAGEAITGRQAGTPSYMAPEQHAGHEASVLTDLYALGLVVYEMLAGHPVWSAEGGPERPTLPASVAEGVDARIKAVLLRCLESDPNRRPASALHVVAALTGRDPLTLAVADGLTLSPEAVAADPRVGSLRPAVATALLVAALACLGGVVALSGHVQAFCQIPSPRPPDVLSERARNLLHETGYSIPSRDWSSGFSFDPSYSRFLATERSGAEARRLLATGRPPLYVFWYRTSPGRLTSPASVAAAGPPRHAPGEAYVELDLSGRLHHLEVFPRGDAPARTAAVEPDWPALLATAGFDAANLKPVPPLGAPPVFADRRAAWDGTYPGTPGLPVHIEVAALQGAANWLDVTGPWARYRDPEPGHEGLGGLTVAAVRLAFLVTTFLAGILLARRNLRLGRGDLRGAFRLAVFAFSITLIGWPLSGKHLLVQAQQEFSSEFAAALYAGFYFWLFYLAFEPSVRRLAPERIVSWNRLLAGRLRDPLVGRDLLIGCLFGLAKTVLSYARGLPDKLVFERPLIESLGNSLQGSAHHLIELLIAGPALTIIIMLLLLALRIVLRREVFAMVILWVLLTWGMATPGPYTGLNLACSGLGSLLVVIAYVRYGAVTGTILWVVYELCLGYPLTLDTSAWYAGGGFFAVLTVAALALYGFATSVAGQPWFTRSGVLDD